MRAAITKRELRFFKSAATLRRMKAVGSQKPRLKAISGGSPEPDSTDLSTPDEELIPRIKAGETDLYRHIVQKYQAKALQIAFGILKNQSDAEDVAQEAFVKAFLSLENFRGESSFYTWLYRIVYNMAIDFRRKLQRTDSKNSEFDESLLNSASLDSSTLQPATMGHMEGPGESLDRKDKAKSLQEALSQLSEEHRVAMILREVDGLSYEDIAEITKVNKGTVMSRLHYARKQLQKLLIGIRN